MKHMKFFPIQIRKKNMTASALQVLTQAMAQVRAVSADLVVSADSVAIPWNST